MENIDPDILHNYYFKDGYYFYIPSRFYEDKDFGFSPDFDEAFSLGISEDFEFLDFADSFVVSGNV